MPVTLQVDRSARARPPPQAVSAHTSAPSPATAAVAQRAIESDRHALELNARMSDMFARAQASGIDAQARDAPCVCSTQTRVCVPWTQQAGRRTGGDLDHRPHCPAACRRYRPLVAAGTSLRLRLETRQVAAEHKRLAAHTNVLAFSRQRLETQEFLMEVRLVHMWAETRGARVRKREGVLVFLFPCTGNEEIGPSSSRPTFHARARPAHFLALAHSTSLLALAIRCLPVSARADADAQRERERSTER